MKNNEQELIIPISSINSDAVLPTRAHSSDAGHDLYSTEECKLKPLERKLVKTGVKIAIPEGFYGRVAPRSGLALKKGIDVMAGVIDSSYRGEIGVVLINLSSEEIVLEAKSKVAQLIIETCYGAAWHVCDNLDDTERSSGGFGSTDNQLPPDISTARPVNLGHSLGNPHH